MTASAGSSTRTTPISLLQHSESLLGSPRRNMEETDGGMPMSTDLDVVAEDVSDILELSSFHSCSLN